MQIKGDKNTSSLANCKCADNKNDFNIPRNKTEHVAIYLVPLLSNAGHFSAFLGNVKQLSKLIKYSHKWLDILYDLAQSPLEW